MRANDGSTVELPLDALLAHQDFLVALARRLTRSEEEAEDLVQDTWVRAMAGPAPRGRSVRAWLAAVVRNAWCNLARREGQRSWREGQASVTETPEPEQVVRELELRRRILAAVHDLPEPHRTTVYLRYYSGLSLGELARRTAVPVETARSRVQRGHELLRQRLDGEFGSRSSWTLALAAWAGEVEVSPAAASASLGESVLGPLAWTVLAAAAGTVLLASGLLTLRGSSGSFPPGEHLGVPTPLSSAASADRGSERTPVAESRQRIPAGEQALQGSPAPGEPAAEATQDTAAVSAGDVDGRPARRDLPARALGVRAAARRGHPGHAGPMPADGAAPSVPETLPGPPRMLRGRLRTADGSSPAGWQIAIRNPSRGVREETGHLSLEALASGRPVTRTVDGSGSFSFEDLLERSYDLIAWHPQTLAHTLLRGLEPDGAPLSVVVGDASDARRIAGRLTSRSGAPIAGARIRPALVTTDEGLRPHVLEHWTRGPAATTDADGRFELPHAAALPLRLFVEGEQVAFGDDFFDLRRDQDVGRLELEIPARCEVRVEIHSKTPPADLLAFLDEHGQRIWIQTEEQHAAARSGASFWRAARLWPGPEGRTLHASEDVRHLMLLDWNGEEIELRPLALDPTRPTVLAW